MELKSLSFAFVKELADFSYEMSVLDRFWNILFPDPAEKWNHLYVNKYKQTFYISCFSRNVNGLEIEPNTGVQELNSMGAPSLGRLVETIRMFLAIHEAGLPISIANPENVYLAS